MEKTLLVIEDEPAIVRYLRASLSTSGWRILEARTAESGFQQAASQNPDIVLLDLGLPKHEALSFLRTLRQWTRTPVILMAGQGQDRDKIEGLEAGADDYLIKPFAVEELTARLGLALRHAETGQKDVLPLYEHHGLRIDLIARRVWFRNKEVHLSPLQYEFLAVLVRHIGQVVFHRELIEKVWGKEHEVTLENMRVFVHQLRQKIESHPSRPRLLKTEPGIGYRLESPSRMVRPPVKNRPLLLTAI